MAPLNEIKKVLNEEEPSDSHGSQQVDEFIENRLHEKETEEENNEARVESEEEQNKK